MALLVQKFGGTSVADSNKILAAARRAISAHNRGERVLVVVSARGHTTDELIVLAKEIHELPAPHGDGHAPLDRRAGWGVALMAMAIHSGVPAISFTLPRSGSSPIVSTPRPGSGTSRPSEWSRRSMTARS